MTSEPNDGFVKQSAHIVGSESDPSIIEASLEPGALRLVYRTWSGLERMRGVPRRSLFDPSDLGRELPHVFLAEKLVNGDYLFRVSGAFIVSTAGFDASMRRMSDCEQMVGRDEIKKIYDSVLSAERPRLDLMTVPWRDREWVPVQRLLLPMVDELGDVKFLLGASDNWERGDEK